MAAGRLYNNPDMYPDVAPKRELPLPDEAIVDRLSQDDPNPPFTLEELLLPSVPGRLLLLAKLKVVKTFLDPVAAFVRAQNREGREQPRCMLDPRYGRHGEVKDCFIPLDTNSIRDLARVVAQTMPSAYKFVRPWDLQESFRDLPDKWLDAARAEARLLLVVTVLTELDTAREMLWYQAGSSGRHGGWQASTSFVDLHDELEREVRNLPPLHQHWRTPVNDHSYHGRPRQHRGRVVDGLSTGRHTFARGKAAV